MAEIHTEHRFDGMHRTEGGGWFGRCTCGHVEVPAASKDDAWAEIADHMVSYNPDLRALREEAAVRRMLGLIP